MSQGREEGAKRSIKKGTTRKIMYITYMAHADNQRGNHCGKLMDGLWQKCVSERHGARTECFVQDVNRIE